LVCRIGLLKDEKCLSCPVLVCAHKHCWRNGGHAIWKHLKEQVATGDFEGVELKAVDCFGSCNDGPNIEFAGRTYSHCTVHGAEKILEPLRRCDTVEK
jgi:NADH:ubiquinone oxidoreductase subunit E